jgi:hypothetical protein
MIATLAPYYGVTGVAIGVIAADAVWAVSLALLAGRLTGRRGDIFAVASLKAKLS